MSARSNSRMSEVSLKRLRQLRDRATLLLENVQADLAPFVKNDGTFRRKPDSPSTEGDVNVTTTCSCLMALSLTNTFHQFYKEKYKEKFKESFLKGAGAIFQSLVKAPWMSSGLTANNAFSTTLVLRTFGFLEEEGLFAIDGNQTSSLRDQAIKTWELHLGIKNAFSLANKLKVHADAASEFLWLSLSDRTRELLKKLPSVQPDPTDIRVSLLPEWFFAMSVQIV